MNANMALQLQRLARQRELVAEIIKAGDNGRATVAADEFGSRRTWASAARELAELAEALDEWRLGGGLDPYLVQPEPTEVGDTYAGSIVATVVVGLDEADPPIETQHDLARLLLECVDIPLQSAIRETR